MFLQETQIATYGTAAAIWGLEPYCFATVQNGIRVGVCHHIGLHPYDFATIQNSNKKIR